MTEITNQYLPTDTFTIELLATIPKKVALYLAQMKILASKEFKSRDLSWKIEKHAGWIQHDGRFDTFRLSWTGPSIAAEDIRCSDARVMEEPLNLDFFISIERLIYDELERLLEDEQQNRTKPNEKPRKPKRSW
jgi:hypothetical protein